MKPKLHYTLHAVGTLVGSHATRMGARRLAQQQANDLRAWVDVREVNETRGVTSFAFNVSPQHQCAHCGEWS